MRLFAQPELNPGNIYDAAFLLLSKFPAESQHETRLVEALVH